MVIDFRKEKSPVVPLQISDSPIEIVDSFKFLCTVIFSGLDWKAKRDQLHSEEGIAENVLSPAAEEVWPGLRLEILVQFYRAAAVSVLCFLLPVW